MISSRFEGLRGTTAAFISNYFKFRNFFYPPNGAAKTVLKVVQLFLLMFYFCVRKRVLDSQFTGGNFLF